MSAADETYDVIVVGLGPTGLTLAHLLGRRGLSVLVLEREPEFYGNARAVYTDDEAMRVFQTAGVADDVHADMNLDCAVQWVRSDGEVLIQFLPTKQPLGWPVVNFLYQPTLETKLEALLDRYPHVEVRRGRELVDLTQDADGVSVVHAASTGTSYGESASVVDETTRQTVRARYLVGADGGRSLVRARLGSEMTGKSFPERWLVVDLAAKEGVDAFGHRPYFDFICDPVRPTVSCPQPGGRHRFEFALTDEDDKDHFEADDDRAPAAVSARQPRRRRGAPPAGLHLQRTGRRPLAGRPGAPGRRRGTHDAAVRRAGHERRHPGRGQPVLEARGDPQARRRPGDPGQLPERSEPPTPRR